MTRTVPSVRHIVAQSISFGGVSVLVKSWRWSVKICRNRRLYLCLPFNNLSKLVHKSSPQKAVKIVQRAVYLSLLRAVCQMCTSPKPDVGLSLWPVSLKVFGCYSNLKENVSNNFKYSYLIYWAFMFLPSPDLNLTPLAAFLRFLPSAASLRSAKNVKKQQEVSDLNQD